MKRYERKLFIDYETRSEINLPDVGAHKYCMHSSTDVILISYAFDYEPVISCTEMPDDVYDAIESEKVLKIAHNAEFDMCVTKYVLGIEISLDDWHDTAYAAAYYGLPRKLSKLATYLKTQNKASQEEMFLFVEPTARGGEIGINDLFPGLVPTRWNDKNTHPKEWERFVTYGETDVIVMRECYNKMPELPEIEQFVMYITFVMNFNGVPWDADLANRIHDLSQRYANNAAKKAFIKYGIKNLRSVPQVQEALQKEGIFLKSLDAKKREGVKHEILDLKDQATGAAFSKLLTAKKRLCPDGMLHGEFMGYGAHTGRWSSKGVQLHNLSRILEDVEPTLTNVKSYSHLRQHIRLCVGYRDGERWRVADLSQIEARITAQLAGCKWRIEAFRNGEDIYSRTAERMFGKKHVSKKDPERQVGKRYDLLLGFGGGKGGVRNADPDLYKERGEVQVQKDIDAWRNASPEIKQLWYKLMDGFREAIQTGISKVYCNGVFIKFLYSKKMVRVVLPSGRSLYYRDVEQIENQYGNYDISYVDYSSDGGNGKRVDIWHGTVVENLVQAIARDVIVVVMQRIHYRDPKQKLSGSVHDEVWTGGREDPKAMNVILNAMCEDIPWFPGLKIKGEGEESDRYRKC